MTGIPAEAEMIKCQGTNKAGEPCNVAEDLLIEDDETSGTYWCYSHHPAYEEERAASRSKGGLRMAAKVRRFRFLHADELGPLTTAKDAARWSSMIAAATATGRLGSAAASVSLKAVEALLRSLEQVDLTERLTELENRVEQERQQRQSEEQRRIRERDAEGRQYLTRDTPTGRTST